MKPSIQRALLAAENQTQDYDRLTTDKRAAVAAWIAATMYPSKNANLYQSSTALTGVFARSAGGFAITNGQCKGAMLAAGLRPVDGMQVHWTFHIRRVRV
jgi:hypothetical protein